MEEADLRLLAAIQDGLPLVSRPFRILGDSLEMSESEVIVRLKSLQEKGVIRRIGPILDMRKLGCSGVLVALKVTPDQADEAARFVNEYKEVSHNYLRPNDSGYNLWFTVSAKKERIQVILAEIRDKTGLDQLVLPTKRIFKIGVKFDII
ncbi:MAG: Lrp/AsnC family transcriptional regulator [Methanotrichaceae archaeon]|nr:Lrp/AsnC family transcriptional regulator [Methanotrichaceae archaeon]